MSSQIELTEYDSSWSAKFKSEKELILSAIGDFVHGGIEHVGSTSVTGLMAKPVIDIMVGVDSLESTKSCIEAIEQLNYKYFPYKPDLMHWFCKPSNEFRTHHLHLIPYQSELWKERIKFRDLLRNNKKIANDYQSLKLELAKKYKFDREKYTQEKWPFIKEVLLNNEH